MQEKIREMHSEVTRIQNAVWALYKDFLSDRDLKKYTRKAVELEKEYYGKGNQLLFNFCQGLLIKWCPVMNAFAEEFRKEEAKKGGGAGDGEDNERV